MKRNPRLFFLSVLLLAGSGFVSALVGYGAEGETYYTRMNIWHEGGKKIMSTNYHKGIIIPAGTEVEILKKGKKIKFHDKTTGIEHKVKLVKDYTNLTQEEFFDRYFSKENILKGAQYASFSDLEKNNIKNGTLEKGMSKAAVLVAYGYPPTHRTPSLDGNSWTF